MNGGNHIFAKTAVNRPVLIFEFHLILRFKVFLKLLKHFIIPVVFVLDPGKSVCRILTVELVAGDGALLGLRLFCFYKHLQMLILFSSINRLRPNFQILSYFCQKFFIHYESFFQIRKLLFEIIPFLCYRPLISFTVDTFLIDRIQDAIKLCNLLIQFLFEVFELRCQSTVFQFSKLAS